MKAKPKTSISQKEAESKAQGYLWHICPQWSDKFFHDHWWEGKLHEAHLAAAVWEVVRRHPRAEELLRDKALKHLSNRLEEFISSNGLQPWPRLEGADQKYWLICLEDITPQRGICSDSRDAVAVIGKLGDSEAEEIRALGREFWDSVAAAGSQAIAFAAFRKAKRVWRKGTSSLMGSGLSNEALQSVSLGHVLIGFDPNRPGIDKLVAKQVDAVVASARERGTASATAGKAYWQTWLKTICRFESAELARKKNEKRDDQLFALYRRTIERLKWVS